MTLAQLQAGRKLRIIGARRGKSQEEPQTARGLVNAFRIAYVVGMVNSVNASGSYEGFGYFRGSLRV